MNPNASPLPILPLSTLETAFENERPRLIRLCTYLTGDPGAAEDLAQETLLEAWRNRHKVSDPEGLSPWLAAIARNVCLRWARRRGASLARVANPERGPISGEPAAAVVDDFDLEVELDRDELATLLDRAMDQLPAPTRDALVDRFIHESPIAEIADHMGVSEGAVAKRLERGKLILRRLLTTDLSAEASAFGILAHDPDSWQETRIWCPGCGGRRLVGRFAPDRPLLALRCPSCHPEGLHLARTDSLDLFADLHGYKPALNRLMSWGYRYHAGALRAGTAPCPRCGRTAGSLRHMPPEGPLRDVRGVHVRCATCRPALDVSLDGLALWHPEGQRFWREHGRIRTVPELTVEIGGRPALVLGFESVVSADRLDVVFTADTYQVLDVRRYAVG